MDDHAIAARAVIFGASASPRRRVITRALGAFALAAIGPATLGAGLALSRDRGAKAHEDRVFEAMVAAPIIAIEAEPAPARAALAPVASPRARRPRALVAAAPVVKTPPTIAAPKVVAALPREAMPPPFVEVY